MTKKIDQLLRDYYESAGFSAGLIHGVMGSAETGEVVLVQSQTSKDTFNCLWSVQKDGQPQLIFDDQTISKGAAELPLSIAEAQARERTRAQSGGVDGLSLSKDGQTMAFTAQGRLIIGRRQAKGNWGFTDSKITAPFDPSLAPDGRHLAVMANDNFQIFQVDQQKLRPLGLSKCPEGLGRNDFVSAEEIHRQTTYTWSDSGLFMAAILTDDNQVPKAQILTGQAPRFSHSQLSYAFAGAPNASQTIYWIDILAGSCQPLPVPARFAGEYLISIDFFEDELRSVWQDSTQKKVVALAWRKRRWVELFSTTDKAWVPVGEAKYLLDQAEPVWLDESEQFGVIRQAGHSFSLDDLSAVALLGERDGLIWAVFLQADRSTKIIGCQLKTGRQQGLPVKSSRAAVWLTGPALVYQARTYLANQAAIIWPDQTEQALVVTQPPKVRRPSIHQASPSVQLTVKLPPGQGPFPVILNTYAGPEFSVTANLATNFVVDEWLCDQGFAVVAVDGRAAPLPNRDFERQIMSQLDSTALDDQLGGLEYALVKHPQLDRARIGVRGWSFGGYFALLCAARRPDLFKAAVAGAPVTDWAWYDTHYTERYFNGTPQQHSKAYAQASLLTPAAAPKIPTLLVHGLADDNVLAAHSLAYLAAHQSDYVTFVPLMAATHMAGGNDLRMSLINREVEFLSKHLMV